MLTLGKDKPDALAIATLGQAKYFEMKSESGRLAKLKEEEQRVKRLNERLAAHSKKLPRPASQGSQGSLGAAEFMRAELESRGSSGGSVGNVRAVFSSSSRPSSRPSSQPSALRGVDAAKQESMLDKMMKFDVSGDGKIDFDEFRKGCLLFGKHMSKQKMEEAFRRIDKDGSGYIDMPEFITSDLLDWSHNGPHALKARNVGYEHENTGAQRMHATHNDFVQAGRANMQEAKTNKALSPELAVAMAKSKLNGNPFATAQQLIKAFQFFDTDGSGSLNKQEITAAIKALQIPASTTTITKIVDEFDTDKSGSVDYHEFLKAFQGSGWRAGIYRPV